MKRSVWVGGVLGALLFVGIAALVLRAPGEPVRPIGGMSGEEAGPVGAGLIHGRVTTTGGDVYEGRLRFGREEEALWGNYFNGRKDENPWRGYLTAADLPRDGVGLNIFGLKIPIGLRTRLDRPLMARFGDIQLIEARGRSLWVTMKSGTRFHLDRYEADDYADGVRVWDAGRGVVDLGERQIRSIELTAPPRPGPPPLPIYGTVRTADGVFTGFVQWDREACLATDLLFGRGPDGDLGIPFEAIGAITALPQGGAAVTLIDGREIILSDTGTNGRGARGMYVDDPRYGRVLVSWQAFERLDLAEGPPPPTYQDFAPGASLRGTVLTRGGRRVTGQLVYDLDESETTETLDAPANGVDYTIPFELIETVEPFGGEESGAASVTLRSGEKLQFERSGDLSEENVGILVFPADGSAHELVRWGDLERIELD